MKLLLCRHCGDVFALMRQTRSCKCHGVEGRYIDNINAEYSGEGAVVLGFSNFSLVQAIKEQDLHGNRADGLGRRFEAFIIPTNAPTVRERQK